MSGVIADKFGAYKYNETAVTKNLKQYLTSHSEALVQAEICLTE